MQAMAVAPVDDQGNVDYSQVVVSYVGTNFGDKKDVLNDLENLGMGFTNKMITGLPSISGMGKGILEGHFNDLCQFLTALLNANDELELVEWQIQKLSGQNNGNTISSELLLQLNTKEN